MKMNKAQNLYKKFVSELAHKSRFFCEHPFLKEIEKAFGSQTIELPKGGHFYRARVLDKNSKANYKDNSYSNPCDNRYRREEGFKGFNKKDSFVPPPKLTKENRASPKGIVYLYVSEDKHTAIAEIRPYMRNRVSVATIEVNENLKIFNLFDERLTPGYNSIYPFSTCLQLIADKFALPLNSESDEEEYLPTQYITEFIRKHEFDGIQYNSSLDSAGKNLVIFNYNKCAPISSDIFEIWDIEYCALGQTGRRHNIEGKKMAGFRHYNTLKAQGSLSIVDAC
jgi:hypothetical protein